MVRAGAGSCLAGHLLSFPGLGGCLGIFGPGEVIVGWWWFIFYMALVIFQVFVVTFWTVSE